MTSAYTCKHTHSNMYVHMHTSHPIHKHTTTFEKQLGKTKVWNRRQLRVTGVPAGYLQVHRDSISCLSCIIKYLSIYLKPQLLAHSELSLLLQTLSEDHLPLSKHTQSRKRVNHYSHTRVDPYNHTCADRSSHACDVPALPIVCYENNILCFTIPGLASGRNASSQCSTNPKHSSYFKNVTFWKCSSGPSSGRLPEWLPEWNLPRTKLSDTNSPGIPELFISLKLPEHQQRPGRFLRFDVTSSQVAKEPVKHPIA